MEKDDKAHKSTKKLSTFVLIIILTNSTFFDSKHLIFMKISRFFYFILIVIVAASCQNSKPNRDTGKLDLLKYGIPDAIAAPKDAEVSKIGQGSLVDISIKNKTDYDVQVFMGDTYTTDIQKLKQDKKVEITANPYFNIIVEEFDQGFIYEKIVGYEQKSYDFKIVKIIGTKEVNYQCGNSKEFTEAEVKKMVASIL